MIVIDNIENIRLYHNYFHVNLVSTNGEKYICPLSPYYQHGRIPIPFSQSVCGKSVFDVWNILRVDDNSSSNQLIRFRKGVGSNEYWDLVEARCNILIPVYCWMLENKVFEHIEYLRKVSATSRIVIFDKSTCCDIYNSNTPLAVSYLLKSYIEGSGPYIEAIQKKIVDKILMIGRRTYTKKEVVYVPNKIANIETIPRLPLDDY